MANARVGVEMIESHGGKKNLFLLFQLGVNEVAIFDKRLGHFTCIF